MASPRPWANSLAVFCDRYPGLRVQTALGSYSFLAGRRNLSLNRVTDYRLAYATTWRVVLPMIGTIQHAIDAGGMDSGRDACHDPGT